MASNGLPVSPCVGCGTPFWDYAQYCPQCRRDRWNWFGVGTKRVTRPDGSYEDVKTPAGFYRRDTGEFSRTWPPAPTPPPPGGEPAPTAPDDCPPEVSRLIARFDEFVIRAVEPDLHAVLVEAPGPGSLSALESRGITPPVPSGIVGRPLVWVDRLPAMPSWGVYFFGDRSLCDAYRSLARQTASALRARSPQLREWLQRVGDNVPGDQEQSSGVLLPIETSVSLLEDDSEGVHTNDQAWRPDHFPLRLQPWTPGDLTNEVFRLLWVYPDVFTLARDYLRVQFGEPAPAVPIDAPRPTPRAEISVQGNEVTIDGRTFPLDDGPAAFVRVLVKAGPGVWVAGREMGELVQPRADRVYSKLPEPIKARIESKTGAGYRILPT